jgi:DNA-binding NarL/FixJ family response regulator
MSVPAADFSRLGRPSLRTSDGIPAAGHRQTYHSQPVPPPRPPEVEDVRVLVVEDRVNVREAVAATIDREPGTTVGQAGTLAEARKMLEGVDVAILDLALPDGNGADLINELHAVNPEAKAVVFTSSVEAAETDQAVERGAAAVISKLDGIDRLLATVRSLRRQDG